MPSINSALVFGVTRIKTSFADDLGNSRSGTGTGFWSRPNGEIGGNTGRLSFITNRHNLDPTLLFGPDTKYKLSKLELEIRRKHNGLNQIQGRGGFLRNTDFLKIALDRTEIRLAQGADVAAIVNPVCINYDPAISGVAPFVEEPAGADFFESKLSLTDTVFFVGFPGQGNVAEEAPVPWWNTDWNVPIVRESTIASWPDQEFSNPSIVTGDTVLVSGLSFTGSSGSPVFTKAKGILINTGPGLSVDNSNYVPPTLVGIMSGHWWNEKNVPEMFRTHSGLSYFTRSTSILPLMS